MEKLMSFILNGLKNVITRARIAKNILQKDVFKHTRICP